MSLIISSKKSAEELAAAKVLHETDVAYMRLALREAMRGAEAGEVPVGAILVIPNTELEPPGLRKGVGNKPIARAEAENPRASTFKMPGGTAEVPRGKISAFGKMSEAQREKLSVFVDKATVALQECLAAMKEIGIRTENISVGDGTAEAPFERDFIAEKSAEISGETSAPSGIIIAVSGNRKERDANPLRHAEMCVLAEGIEKLGKYLDSATLYVTLEPCAMCAGAMVNARLKRLVFGAADPKGGAAGSVVNILENPLLNHTVTVKSGVLGTECGAILSEFFKRRREEKK